MQLNDTVTVHTDEAFKSIRRNLARGGRPTTLTEDIIDQTSDLIADSAEYIEDACQALGVPRRNYYNWQKQGERDSEHGIDSLQARFWHTTKAAESQGMVRLGKLWIANPREFAAYATRKERKAPDKWARRQDDANVPRVVVQIGVKDGDVQVNLGALAVNHNAPYQNQTDSEAESGQALTGASLEAFAGESEGRKLLDVAKVSAVLEPALAVAVGQTLPANLGAGIPRGTLPGARAAKPRKEKPLQRALLAARKAKKKGHVKTKVGHLASRVAQGAKTPR